LKELGCDVNVVDILERKRGAVDLRMYEVSYFSFIKTTKSNSPGLIAKRLSFSFFSAMKLLKLKYNFDVVHFHNQFPAVTFELFTKLSSKKIPIVYTLHNPTWGLPEREMPKDTTIRFALEIRAMKSANKIIAVSETLNRNLINYLDLNPSSIVVIPNGVDANLFHPSRASPTLWKQLALNGEKIVLCVGRICRYKAQKMLIDVAPEIIQEYSNIRFVFVGPIDDAKYFKEINNAINLQSLRKYYVFTGNVSSNLIPEFFATSYIFVLPSVTEGLPLTLLQAMSSGRAIVASGIPQNKEVAVCGNEAKFFEPSDKASLVNSILMLLADEKLRRSLGENARRTAVRYFDWKVIARRTLQLYEELS